MDTRTFEQWLNDNNDRFLTYTLEEIADEAIAIGYPKQEVTIWHVKLRDRRMCA